MQVKNAKFVISAVRPEQYPKTDMLETAFCGRSNAGKSSLINALTGRKRLAFSGSTQGMTRQINFYNLDDEMMFVDLPGYGYAAVSHGQKQLYMIILIVDARHDPSEDDVMMFRWMKDSGLAYAVVANKCDKLSRMKQKEQEKRIKTCLGMESGDKIYLVSATGRTGIEELWECIDGVFSDESE